MIATRLQMPREMPADAEFIQGSGNAFRDLARPDAHPEQLRSILAACIIGVLDERGLSVTKAK